MSTYNHQDIEKKWQARWEQNHVGVVTEAASKENNRYHLIMFPYPSGAGLHVGHVESYSAVDILTRFERMRGKNVLFPIGYDAFGLPAENYAIKTGVHPAETTTRAIENFRRQMKSMGLSFDWSREISTADPAYYKWTQWLFLLLYKNGLAYRAKAPVNWCPSCQTVLANEQVVGGACERCHAGVVQKDLEQWFFKITDYAERLLNGLEKVDWPERIKTMQRNWIGKSEGALIRFVIASEAKQSSQIQKIASSVDTKLPPRNDFIVEVFTTRPDTLFGATYLVLAPEHPLVDTLVTNETRAMIEEYRSEATKKSTLERTELQKEKTGIFTGAFATNPATQELMPIWIADYVVLGYGTGAIMAVPAHDERDFTFAKKYDLSIRKVIFPLPKGEQKGVALECFDGEGINVESDFLNGLTTPEAKKRILTWLEEKHIGQAKTTFRIRDWLVSRQRYWGAPIPIIWCESCGIQPVSESDLPVLLPEDVDFKPTGQSPLVDSSSFHDVTCPSCGKKARRESDTMDTFVDSSWYYLRYTDPHNAQAFAGKHAIQYWCPVDMYVGGAEHAVLHLLYARFFAYALHDLGYLDFEEPFLTLRNQGLVLGPDGEKMSKSRGNVISPDEIVAQYGADAIRMYEMFMGPLEDTKPWDTKGVVGIRRFLDKVWHLRDRLSVDHSDQTIERQLHHTIKKVTKDIQHLKFNTAISQLMIFTNACLEFKQISSEIYFTFLKLLAPFAPHLSEELWEQTGHTQTIFFESWPTFDPAFFRETSVCVAIQINGKMRGTIELALDTEEDAALEAALALENIKRFIEGKDIQKVIYVPGRVINIVI